MNNMNISFLHILFYYLNNLQFKFELIQKFAWNAFSYLNKEKWYKKLLNFHMEYHVLYVERNERDYWVSLSSLDTILFIHLIYIIFYPNKTLKDWVTIYLPV
jgi:hypothetical protein